MTLANTSLSSMVSGTSLTRRYNTTTLRTEKARCENLVSHENFVHKIVLAGGSAIRELRPRKELIADCITAPVMILNALSFGKIGLCDAEKRE